MELLVAVINHAELLEQVLAGLVELGIPGATVLESRGMARLLRREVPLLAGVPESGSAARAENRTVLCVVDGAQADRAIAMMEAVIGGFSSPGAGIAFTVPVSRAVGVREAERAAPTASPGPA